MGPNRTVQPGLPEIEYRFLGPSGAVLLHADKYIQEGMTTLQIIQRIPPHSYRGVPADIAAMGKLIAMILTHQPTHPFDRADFGEN